MLSNVQAYKCFTNNLFKFNVFRALPEDELEAEDDEEILWPAPDTAPEAATRDEEGLSLILFGTFSHAALLLDSDFIFIESGTPRFRFTESELAWSLEALLGLLRLFECLPEKKNQSFDENRYKNLFLFLQDIFKNL